MSEQPSAIARDAKQIMHLKELLKTKEPFDREIDFQRKNLRRRHLSVTTRYPYAKESENAEHTLDADILCTTKSGNPSRHGPVEHRKLLQRFPHPVLVTLGICPTRIPQTRSHGRTVVITFSSLFDILYPFPTRRPGGNPSHQLAYPSNGMKRTPSLVSAHYRSLCVKHPYETASDNMDNLLSKTLDHWRPNEKDDIPSDIAHVPKVLIEEFKKGLLFCMHWWWLGHESNDQLTVKEVDNIFNQFYRPDIRSDIYPGALESANASGCIVGPNSKSKSRSESSLPSTVIEARIYTHLLSLYRAILERAHCGVPEDITCAENCWKMAQSQLQICQWPVLKRRVYSTEKESRGTLLNHQVSSAPHPPRLLISGSKYAEFLRALSRAFPAERLPDLSFPLLEDIEMERVQALKDLYGPAKRLWIGRQRTPEGE
ncbi:hypothetical protein BT96DRAFT_988278 [Gymnopus androsaceus JB14]|uniref:Uncharacterized protein n=1 Tax=Gymnopus androsaceus JB14 TaxID=1447944 RepID=A0A6A4I8T4_9AGAR|nr:hypothetical protein BT96DRAFT_988278 [Gymnopus androsaceus JB14]